MSYQLGVDLGTTFTAAAVARDGQAGVVTLGSRSMAIPSVLLFREDGTVLTGDAANRRALNEPERVAREFKRRFGDGTPILVGGAPFSAEALTAKLLRWVVDEVEAREGGSPSQIVISHPANWGPYKMELLDQVVQIAGLSDVGYVSEPHAAAIFYANQARVEAGAVVAVYDLGGGTFDAAVLRKTEIGFEIMGDPKGIERLGGIDFDAAVYGFVARSLENRLDHMVAEDPTSQAAVARLRHDCVDAKEALSSDTDVSIQVLLPEIRTEVRMTRREFEDLVRPALAQSIAALHTALDSAGIEPADVTTVLLVGGSSRIPLVAQMIGAELGRPVSVDADPKHAVAMGAAIHGSTRSSPVLPTTPTVTPDQLPAPPVSSAATAPATGPPRLSPETSSQLPPPPVAAPETIPSAVGPPPSAPGPPPGQPPPSAPGPRNQRRALISAVVIVLVVVVAVTIASLARSDKSTDDASGDVAPSLATTTSPPATIAPTTTTITVPTPARAALATINVGAGPRTPIATGGFIWVSNNDDGTVSVIDPTSWLLIDTITVGTGPRTPIAAHDLIWVPNFFSDTISVIDPTSRTVIDTITVGTGPRTPIAAFGLIWVPDSREDTISVIDPITRTQIDTITVGAEPRTPIVAHDLIWVPNSGDDTISVIDPNSRAQIDTITVGSEPATPIAAYDLIWVPNSGDFTISVIDPTNRALTDSIRVGTGPSTPVATDGLIWVPDFLSDTISVIDPNSRTRIDTIAVGSEPATPIAAYDVIWVPNLGDVTMSVIDPNTATVIETITVGVGPLVPLATSNLIWVANRNGGTVSVIEPTP